jgi:hypothetical protein
MVHGRPWAKAREYLNH